MPRLLAAACVMLMGCALAACVQSHASRCGKLTCPMGMSCGPSGDVCVYTDMLEACRSVADGAPCTVSGLAPNQCMNGVCQASRCGDGRITGAEQCDGALLGTNTCLSLGFYRAEGLTCTADCKFDTARCVGKCGDGIKNGPEQCDGSDLGGSTCFAAGFYAAPGLACKSDCTFDTATCGGGRCGDGVLNGLEQCDGTSMGSVGGKVADCGGIGFQGATTGLKCSKTCRYSATSCLCTATARCAPGTQRCECSKTGGCGCVAVK
ncbi:MAG TPA: hypothetical protein VHT91_44800 [Kofleriaceae bacterium]|nr:hypothetical protein [Kofleriaceae bacterium]